MGRDKLRLQFGGDTLLRSAVNRFSQCFDNVYVSVGDAEKYPEVEAERVVDVYPGCGPISGLHAALGKTKDEGVFMAAADLPFSSPEAALKIMELCGDASAAMLVDEMGRFEPTFGYYKKELLPEAERLIKDGRYKLMLLFDNFELRKISRDELGELWSERLLDNINYPEDYERILREEIK
jgi:molybdopterin-guanine dinucleotide biosynthesis protein A